MAATLAVSVGPSPARAKWSCTQAAKMRRSCSTVRPATPYRSTGWLHGSGYVIVGDVKRVAVSGVVDDPNQTIGAGDIAVLKSAATFKLPDGECSVTAVTGDLPLTIVSSGGKARFGGFITGNG